MKPEILDKLICAVEGALADLAGDWELSQGSGKITKLTSCAAKLNWLLGYLEGLKGGDAK